MNKDQAINELTPLIYDETDDIHRTDYPGLVNCLFMAHHIYYQEKGSTTLTTERN